MASVTVRKEANHIAVVTLAKEPVNSMNLDLMRELLKVLETLEADPSVRAIVFESGLKKNVFTAGLDINELYAPSTSQERLHDFWLTLTAVLTKVYSSKWVTAAAIKGACPAGGCALALCCDYRVITADGSMGLNEVQLGIPVPMFWIELFANVVGQRQAERLLQTGELVSGGAQLRALGLVDQVVETPGDALPAALAEVGRWLKCPDVGRIATKEVQRGDFGRRWAAGKQLEAAAVWKACSDPRTVDSLSKVLQRLSGGSKKAPASKL